MDEKIIQRLNYSFEENEGVRVDPEQQKELAKIEVSSDIDPAVADALLGLLDEYEGWNPYDVKWVDEVCVQLMGGNGQEAASENDVTAILASIIWKADDAAVTSC